MATIKEELDEAKLHLLTKLTSLQREVISITDDATDRDLKNLNKACVQVNAEFDMLTRILSK